MSKRQLFMIVKQFKIKGYSQTFYILSLSECFIYRSQFCTIRAALINELNSSIASY